MRGQDAGGRLRMRLLSCCQYLTLSCMYLRLSSSLCRGAVAYARLGVA